MFVLFGCVAYEGSELLGVYSSSELAVAAWEVYVQSESVCYYYGYSVVPVVVDAPADESYLFSPVVEV